MSRARDTASIIQYNHLTIDDANDRIGIGISAPIARLDVRSDVSTAYDATDDDAQRSNTSTISIKNEDGTINSFAQLTFDTAGSNQSIARIVAIRSGTASNDLAFVTEHSNTKAERVRITSAGSVGIGTDNPSHTLDVVGNTQLYGTVVVGDNTDISPDASGAGQFSIDANGYSPYIAADGTAMYIGHNSTSRDLRLQTNETDRLTIDGSTGNIGIGTDNPAVKLHVYGGALRIAGNDSEGGEINFTDNDGTTVSAHIDVDTNGDFRMFTTDANKSLIIGQLVNSGANITFHTSAAERVRIDSSGNFGVGTTSPGSYPGKLVVVGDAVVCDREFISRVANTIADSERGFTQLIDGSNYLQIYAPNGGDNVWKVAAQERLRIDTSGRLLINQSTSSPSFSGVGAFLQVNEGSGVALSINRNSGADAFGANLVFRKTRSSSANGTTVVASGDGLGQIYWMGTDGTSTIPAAAIVSAVDGTPGANDMPGLLVFSTTADGASSPTERFRIDSRGSFQFSNGFMNETVNINTTARTGTQTVNLDDGMVHYFSTNSTGTWKPNFTMSTGNDINATIATGDVFSPTMIVAKGATTHYATTIQVDGTDVTPEWLGGAPTDGGGSGTFDVYSYSIIKTGNDTFKAFASVSTYE